MASGLTCKNQTRLERLVRDEHTSLLQTFLNYGLEKFYNIGPGVSNLRGLGPSNLLDRQLRLKAMTQIRRSYAILPTRHSIDSPFCQLAHLSICLCVNLLFPKLNMSSTSYFINLPFHQIASSSTDHFVNLPFHQLTVLSTCLLVNSPFHQLIHFIN